MPDKDIEDDYDESASYPDLTPSYLPTSPHPHARMGEPMPMPVPGLGRTLTPDDMEAIDRFATQHAVEGIPEPRQAPKAAKSAPRAEKMRETRQQPSQPPRTMRFEPLPPQPVAVQAPPMHPGAESGYHHQYEPMQVPANPLANYQRMPGLSIRLPTDGRFMPQGAIQFNMDCKVQVSPMRAADELLLKSPDALMSGFAVECLLQSCVPGIRYPRMISNPDLEVLLLAIKAASNGYMMEIEYECPKCKEQSSIEIDLREYLATAITDMPDNSVTFDNGMRVYMRPYNLHNSTQMQLGAYNEARAIQAAEAKNQQEAERQMVSSLKVLTDLDILMTADCVLQIVVPEGVVNDKQQIMEFIPTLPERDVKKLGEKLSELNGAGIDKDTPVQCAACHHEWTTKAEFDPASFFGENS